MIGRTDKMIAADWIKIVAALLLMAVLWPIGWLMELYAKLRGRGDGEAAGPLR